MLLPAEFDELEDLLAAHGIALSPFPRVRGKVGMGVLSEVMKMGAGVGPHPSPPP